MGNVLMDMIINKYGYRDGDHTICDIVPKLRTIRHMKNEEAIGIATVYFKNNQYEYSVARHLTNSGLPYIQVTVMNDMRLSLQIYADFTIYWICENNSAKLISTSAETVAIKKLIEQKFDVYSWIPNRFAIEYDYTDAESFHKLLKAKRFEISMIQ